VAVIFKTLMYGDDVAGYPSLMATITFMSGVQLLTIGLLGEYVGKTYLEAKQRPVYLVRDVRSSRATPVTELQTSSPLDVRHHAFDR